MATSQNLWPVLTGYGDPKLVRIPYITGKMLGGDVAWIFTDFNEWFHRNVESLTGGQADDWAFAPRPIAGSSVISNHASGTAEDLNASRHPMFRDTMDAAKEAKIRQRLKRYKGAIRWGGDYRAGRLDQMHFEINVSPARLRQIVAELKAEGTIKPTAPSKPKPITPGKPKPVAKAWPHVKLREDGKFEELSVKALQTMLKGIDLYRGKIDGRFDADTKAALQLWLKQRGFYKGYVDGKFGDMSVRALQAFLVDRGFLPSKAYIDGNDGPKTWKAFQAYINSQAEHYK